MDKLFKVRWVPKSQARHRHTKYGHTYDPSTKDKKEFVSLILNQLPNEPISDPIAISIVWHMPYPKKWLRTGKYEGLVKDNAPSVHTSKPDIDNMEKFLFDSLNGRLWVDDALIWWVQKQKVYAVEPGITFKVEVINERECECISHWRWESGNKTFGSDY